MKDIYNEKRINAGYERAKEVYSAFGVDTEEVFKKMKGIPISLHCWQGDDVSGFEAGADGISGGGIMATGNYPGRARNGEELRQDLDKALSLIPGKHRVNLHSIYAETDGKVVERDQLSVEHFKRWIAWAKKNGLGLDFNPSFFSHKLAESGYTLSSKSKEIREFWISHGKKSREIAAAIGKELGTPCVNNIWIPDGSKDITADRAGYRRILKDSLDEVLKEKYDKKHLIDTVECKLFGIGSESYVVGSHEFYMGYAMKNNVMLCLDAGHFHPTEVISDKISSVLTFSEEVLLHVSRGVRWDSDHVVILNDELMAIAQEVKRCDAYGRIHFGLDFFDASINRITAWVTGTRAALKAIILSLLEPTEMLVEAEEKGDLGGRLALLEELKSLPFGAVWDKYCHNEGVPAGAGWLNSVSQYEKSVLSNRK
ncbi:L-rhamnose isomerase [Anaerobacterium chartisolvens]|uniref:L-rhamnose isomerase n=1 Tax=Anaerobacterium chartisolvens TaxID=1297424 RepID=A0A369AV15_9FIRM|nr:L-rhamnose isomerase [Anaerobacterium chartisolvens]RCX13222.1 L-rhamnose isomerase [Anaerobacterium chartisolvens]